MVAVSFRAPAALLAAALSKTSRTTAFRTQSARTERRAVCVIAQEMQAPAHCASSA